MIIWRFGAKSKLLILTILIGLSSLKYVFLAQIVGSFIEAATKQSMAKFWQISIYSVLGFFVFSIIGILEEKVRTRFVADINLKIKNETLHSVIVAGDSNNNDRSLSFFTNDLKLLEKNGIDSEISMIDDVLTFISAVCMALVLDVPTSLCFLIGALLPLMFSNITGKVINDKSKKWSQANAKYTDKLKEVFSGITHIRNYNAEDSFVDKLRISVYELEKALRKMDFTVGFVSQLTYFLTMVLTLTFPFGVGIYRILTNYISLAVFISIVNLSNSLSSPIVDLVQMINEINTTRPISKKVQKYVSLEKEAADKGTLEINSINLKNIEFSKNGNEILKNINLTINKGEKVLIQGPSGIGKSTLLHIISGDFKKFSGDYLINDHLVDTNLRGHFAYCEQEPYIFSGSLKENICFGKDVESEKLDTVIKKAKLENLIAERGLDFRVENEGNNLSGGQKQRIEIARAMLRNDRILLIDEGTSAMHNELAQEVRENYLGWFDTVIEVAHWLEPNEKNQYDKTINLI